MSHRTAQCALLGAVHGVEQHCASLFADWNRQALQQHAQHVATSLSAGASTGISNDVSPSRSEQQMQSPLAAVDSSPSPSAQHRGGTDGQSEQQSAGEQYQAGDIREGGLAPRLSSKGPCTDVSQPNSHAEDCPTIARTVDSTAGSMAGAEAADALAECPGQFSAPQEHQPPCCPIDGTESMSGVLQAVLKGPLSSAKALAVLAAVHTGTASLGLAAGLGRMPWPLYLIGTRDSFTHHLHAEHSRVSPHTIAPPYAMRSPNAQKNSRARLHLDCQNSASWLIEMQATVHF